MAKANIVVCDPPWSFSDKLKQSSVKRGAASNYSTMPDQDIINLQSNLPVKDIVADNALLALWVPSSKLETGMECVKSYGFAQKQIWIWVKLKKRPDYWIPSHNIRESLSFGMGRLWRQSHELVLVGTRGKIYKELKNKSQRSVYFWPNEKHSKKPEGLQDQLDLMFPKKSLVRLELFARRQRNNYLCCGLEAPMTEGEDILKSLEKFSRASQDEVLNLLKQPEEKMSEIWRNL